MAEIGLDSGADTGGARRANAGRRLTSVQLMLAVALTLGLVLALNFSSRIKLDRDLDRIHDDFARQIDALLADQGALLTELEYVKSDAFVEYWAHDEGKMVRDGEVLIQPQGVGVQANLSAPSRRLFDLQTTAPEPENWQLWWALLFDGAPPVLN